MAAPICEEVSALVKLVLARAPGEEAGGRAVGRTLDSSSALCQGASLVAALRNPTAVQNGTVCEAPLGGLMLLGLAPPWDPEEMCGLTFEKPLYPNGTVPAVVCATPLEEAGGKGMGASLLAAALQERVRIDRMQLELVLIEAEVNQLEAMISETRREISEGPYKHLADAARSNELVDAAEEWVWQHLAHVARSNELVDATEEWVWQAPEGGYRLGEYREKTAALREELEKANGKVYAARREAQEKDHREMEQQAKEDGDNRKFNFEDRFRTVD
ncbi:hypothetical protein T484DRAFT_1761859 [Baffinella frigidus]|nr:hypothetical protein T484DRAFT_1761859 [Cryptophyta sp. CCMP2293]